MLRLEAIKFNHDSSSANVDAFNIRKDRQEFVKVPEWRRGVTFNPEDSPAAYALSETREHTLTIEVNVSCDDSNLKKVSIKALDPNFHREPVNSSNLSEHDV